MSSENNQQEDIIQKDSELANSDSNEDEPQIIESIEMPEESQNQDHNIDQTPEQDNNNNEQNQEQQQDIQQENDKNQDQNTENDTIQQQQQNDQEENTEKDEKGDEIHEKLIEILKEIKCLECDSQVKGDDQLIQYCQECIEEKLGQEEQEIDKLDEKIKKYEQVIASVCKDIEQSENTLQEQEKLKLHEQEKDINEKMKNLQELEKAQEEELQQLKNEVLKLEMKESEYWSKINNHQKNFVKLEEKIQQADNYLKKLNQDIININQVNVVNDVFYIFVDEQAATINNLIIGKKKEQQNVDWDQTNAGLGQIAMLFTYLKQKYQYKYQMIDYIMCNGNYSTVQTRSNHQRSNKYLNLYGPFGKEVQEDYFNMAISFLAMEFKLFCEFLNELEAMKVKNIQINLPYDINGEYIISGNNQYSFNTNNYKESKWDHWTQTMKYLLADFKYIIAINAEFDRKSEQEFIKQL